MGLSLKNLSNQPPRNCAMGVNLDDHAGAEHDVAGWHVSGAAESKRATMEWSQRCGEEPGGEVALSSPTLS
jgi:hypothetical protein